LGVRVTAKPKRRRRFALPPQSKESYGLAGSRDGHFHVRFSSRRPA